MTLADTSAWIEYLRATGSDVHQRVRALVRHGEVATTDVVLMEVLAGARDDGERAQLARLLALGRFVPVRGPGDYEDAADLYRRCRRAGETIRALTDCLIAVVAMREGLPLLHRDAGFGAIARHAPLRIA